MSERDPNIACKGPRKTMALHLDRPVTASKPVLSRFTLGIEIHDRESDPATHNSDSRVSASEHQGKEFQPAPKNDSVEYRTICYQGYGERNVKQREAVKQPDSGLRSPGDVSQLRGRG
jgi:hypothetical protein